MRSTFDGDEDGDDGQPLFMEVYILPVNCVKRFAAVTKAFMQKVPVPDIIPELQAPCISTMELCCSKVSLMVTLVMMMMTMNRRGEKSSAMMGRRLQWELLNALAKR